VDRVTEALEALVGDLVANLHDGDDAHDRDVGYYHLT